MMWGPGVAKVAADLAVTGTTDVVDVTDLGLTRFDADGRSSLAADPIALPFPKGPPHDQRSRSHPPARRRSGIAELETGPARQATGHPDGDLGATLWKDGEATAGSGSAKPARRGGCWTPTRSSSHGRRDDGHAGRRGAAEVNAGDVAIFPKGWSRVWDIHEKVRKV